MTIQRRFALAAGMALAAVGAVAPAASALQETGGKPAASPAKQESPFRAAGVRYQVKDVRRAVEFYAERLGFAVDQSQGTAFAAVSKGTLKLWLSGPGSSGARPLPGGKKQEPGGSNRIVLEVTDLPARIAALKAAGVRFRNEMETGPGGRQVQVEDPDGNPVELFEPAARP